jgi:hypothetical protein
MEGNCTTPKNCVLTNFLNERSTIFFLVFSLIRFWIFVRNDFYQHMWQYWCVVLNFTIRFTIKSNWLLGCNFLQCQSSEIGPHGMWLSMNSRNVAKPLVLQKHSDTPAEAHVARGCDGKPYPHSCCSWKFIP